MLISTLAMLRKMFFSWLWRVTSCQKETVLLRLPVLESNWGGPESGETRAVSGFGRLLLRPAPKQATHEKSTRGGLFMECGSGALAAPAHYFLSIFWLNLRHTRRR
jgi:hypothetical protein